MTPQMAHALSGVSDDTVDYAEASQLACGVSKDVVRAAVRAGRIRAWKFGRRTVRLHRGDVIAWAESRRVVVDADGGGQR